jgi:DNA-binding winged helix-turn-helix (wHTH) protein
MATAQMRVAFGDCVFDSETREVFRGERPVALSPKAFALLELLIASAPKAVSKKEIHERLWPATFVTEANLANLVTEVRAALGDSARQSRILATVQRFGYAFRANVKEAAAPSKPRGGGFSYRLLWGIREIALSCGENVLGREQSAAIWIDDSSVSRRHARVVVGDSEAFVEDLGSKNGTLLNGRRLQKKEVLSDGDAIVVGPARLTLRVLRHAESTKTASRARKR